MNFEGEFIGWVFRVGIEGGFLGWFFRVSFEGWFLGLALVWVWSMSLVTVASKKRQ